MAEIYTPPTRKSFSLSAIALWGERLATAPAADWEHFFSDKAVHDGRRLYHSMKIAEIVLETDGAAVVFRVPAPTLESDFSALAEALGASNMRPAFLQIIFNFDESGVPHWRNSSSAPREEVAPFAVAALYVIEEFVGNEFPKLPLSAGAPTAAGTHGNSDKKSAGADTKSAVPAAEATDAVPARADRPLCVRFASAENELSFTALWKNGEDAEAALGDSEQKTPPSAREREQLLRLVTAARKADFEFDPARRAYVLAGTVHAVRFATELFPLWQKRFEIENSAVVAAFACGSREIDASLLLNAESHHAFGLKWVFSLDGRAFSENEIRAVLRHRGESVFLPGRGIVRLRAGTRAIADDWPDAATHGLPIYTLLSLFRGNETEKVLVPDAKLRAWRKNFLKEPEPPADLPAFLRPYQARGVAWIRQMFLRGAHPLLADEMGLGKTLQTLALLALDADERRPALIVCPASVIPVWKNEIRQYFPQFRVKVLGVDGDFFRRKTSVRDRNTGGSGAGAGTLIWLASYGMLRANAEILPKKKFSCAVLDEAQFIKNPQAKATQACLKIVAERRLALTGTPIENRPVDLWSVFRFLMPGLLGRRTTLETEIAEAHDETLEKLKTQIAPFILRRTKQDVARELPKKVQSVLLCPLTPQQREIYSRLVREGLNALGAGTASAGTAVRTERLLAQNATHLLTLLMRLRQAACDPALLPGNSALPVDFSGKISVLLERLDEIVDNGGKVVVFSQFVSLLERVRSALDRRFAGTPIFTLTGKTLDRDAPVKNFQSASGAAIFLVSLRAGGTGLTLSRAEYVFLLDPWWNPAVEEQAIDRVHRIGQTRRVFVYRMVAAGTIEERIERLKQSKRAMFDTLVGALPDMSDWASHYPSLESLIALSE